MRVRMPAASARQPVELKEDYGAFDADDQADERPTAPKRARPLEPVTRLQAGLNGCGPRRPLGSVPPGLGLSSLRALQALILSGGGPLASLGLGLLLIQMCRLGWCRKDPCLGKSRCRPPARARSRRLHRRSHLGGTESRGRVAHQVSFRLAIMGSPPLLYLAKVERA